MRAMLLEKPAPISTSPLKRVEIDSPVPEPHQIAVKVAACGVCHTDLHTVEGDLQLPWLPLIPGHQVVGKVEVLGKNVTRFKVGDRVGIAWLHWTCGSCRFCTSGRENLCPEAQFTGFHHNGGYSDFVCAPEKFAYHLPEGFSDIQAAPLLCAGIIGYRALELTGIQAGGRLGLYGFGASAHVTIQIARHRGIEVYVFSRGEGHRRLAKELGAVWTGQVPDRPHDRLDASIIFAPAGDLVPPALEALDRGGTLVLGGIHMSPVPVLDYKRHLYCEKTLRSVTASTRRDGQEFLELAASIPVRTQVTTYPLMEANRALRDIKEGRIDGAAVLIP
ncbi:MAG: zinc-dependent alcohol dehydrogenase family protein [bacterium]|nr:zinc-dependent alcohol dehydrogenase family protein [bacterium]MDT8366934.1 zinc-dependent alcohol dehydrogenase family protein [bacterium]